MKNKKWIKPYLYCLSISFLFLMICSKNSFCYQMNDWVDANAFFTVGKSMVRGIVPYQALFEQKGPLLYLIYGVGSLISYKSFIGVFLLEVFSFSIFLYYTYKIITLFFDENKAYFSIPLFTLCILTLNSFSHGGSVEEFSLSFFMISLYYLIRYLKESEIKIPRNTVLITGIIAGCILWMKYTLLGFWFGWMLCIFGIACYHRQYKIAIQNCFIYLLGMLIATVPWLIYFGIHNALSDLWNVYFLVNMNAYPKDISIAVKIITTISLLVKNLFGNIIFFVGIMVGFLLLFQKGNQWGKRGANLTLLTCFLTTGIFIYIGGTSYHYYPFILSPFILVVVLILLSSMSKQSWEKLNLPCLIMCLIAAYHICGNTKMMFLSKENYAQYQFAKIIEKSDEPTILNYGFLDGGFYTITGNLPNFYYFMKNNISYQKYPEMMDQQREYVREKQPNFVIAKSTLSLVHRNEIEKNYQLIAQHTQKYQTKQVTYLLYERKR